MQKDDFLEKVRSYAGLESPDEALKITKVFLATLGEWLYRTEARKLAAQLPKEFKDFLFDEQKPEQSRDDVVRLPLDQFYNRIKARSEIGFREAVKNTKAVSRVLQEAISRGEIESALRELPDDFSELFAE